MRTYGESKLFRDHVVRGGVAGFTLIELLVVMTIMVLLMGIGTASYFGIRRGAELRGAVGSVRTTLMLARQQAITKHRKVVVKFLTGPTNSMQILETDLYGNSVTSHPGIYLTPGVEFSNNPTSVTFYAVGGVTAGADLNSVPIGLRERVQQSSGGAVSMVWVWPLTGVTRVQ